MAAMFDLSKITVYKKKKRNKKPGTSQRLQNYADQLEKQLPKSEQWFRSMWLKDVEQDHITLYQDCFNHPLGKYIPDVINRGYKYIIEIDGSIHDTPTQQWKDKLKDQYYNKQGYQVFRIKAYDESNYLIVLEQVRKHILYIGRQY